MDEILVDYSGCLFIYTNLVIHKEAKMPQVGIVNIV